MRFTAEGPSIPDELLVARDAGKVLFFCGAGVSRASAGLPDFNSLAKLVMQSLGVIDTSPAKRVFEAADRLNKETAGANVGGLVAADRLFALLEREFDVADVRRAVAEALRPVDLTARDLTPHRTLLDLSKGRVGVPRLVTTNFDLLFEACDESLARSGPSSLPDPRREHDFHGIIHLHGRVTDLYDAAYGDELVLSSADFGHAYLAEGWATRYINLLLQQFQIVFVGYSADDPPVQYLLEALNRFGPSQRNAMYAFHWGNEHQAVAQWAHKGVTPLAFREFSHLWETLSAWASRARNVDKWHDDLIKIASVGPASMQPHERGMVAHLASTEEGSHRLANAESPIPAEWLFVFDKYARFNGPAQEHANSFREGIEFFKKVCLDSDATPEVSLETMALEPVELPGSSWDAFAPTDIDLLTARPESLSRIERSAAPPLPRRLANLGRWLGRVAHQPAALIWAAGETSLHADLRDCLTTAMRVKTARYSEQIRKQWQWILESWNSDRYDVDNQFHIITTQVEIDGWTPTYLRAAMQLYRARLDVKPAFDASPFVQQAHQLVHASIEYVHPYRNFSFPASVLPDALSLLRQEIERAIQLETELQPDFLPWLEAALVRHGQDKNQFAYGITVILLTYIDMLLQLSETDRDIAKAELARWPRGTAIAERLNIAAAAASAFFSPEEAGDAFAEMSEETFWDPNAEQDLTTALGLRWSELPEAARRDIERRAVHGPIPSYGSSLASEVDQAYVRLSRLYAFKDAGIDLTTRYATEFHELRAAAPDWTESAWQERPQPGVFSVSLDTDSSVFHGVPLNQIVDVAREHHGKRARRDVEAVPFLGLARDQPSRALRALDLASRRGDRPIDLWHTMLSEQVSLSGRQATMVAHRITKLPAEFLSEIRRQAAKWLHEHALDVWKSDPQVFTALWNALLGTLLTSQTEVIKPTSHRWVNESLNSTAGQLVGALFATLAASCASTRDGLDVGLKDRLTQLLNLPAPHWQRALFMIATRLDWMYARDPEWVRAHLLVLAPASESSDPFFQGTLTTNELSWNLVQELQPHMLERLYEQQLTKSAVGVLAATLLNCWLEKDDPAQNEKVSDLQLREILVRSDNDFRTLVIRHLAMWSKKAAGSMDDQVLKFIDRVWPLQSVVKTAEMTERLVGLALAIPGRFTEAVTLLRRRMVQASDRLAGSIFYQIDDRIIADHCPALVDLLWQILPASSALWGDGIDNLIQRLEVEATPQHERLAELRRRAKYRI